MTNDLPSARARLAYHIILDRALHEIMFQPSSGQTPGARLRQYGMMVLLLDLVARNKPLTITQIVDVTGMTRGAAEQVLCVLEERGLVAASWVKNSIGRGKARIYQLCALGDAEAAE